MVPREGGVLLTTRSSFKSEPARLAFGAAYEATLATSSIPVSQADVSGTYGTTHVLSAGDPANPTIVALHGKTASSTMWAPHLRALCAQHHVVMLDTVGDLNKSVMAKPIANRADAARWLDQTLDSIGVGSASYVGVSYGGWLAATYAMQRPSRVTRVALLGPAGIFANISPMWAQRAMRATWLRPTRTGIDAFVRSIVQPHSYPRLAQSPYRELFEQWHVGLPEFRPSPRDRFPTKARSSQLASMKMPTLVIYGAQETLCNGPRAAQRARTALPHAQVELLDDANHCVDIDQPERVEQLLVDFFKPNPT